MAECSVKLFGVDKVLYKLFTILLFYLKRQQQQKTWKEQTLFLTFLMQKSWLNGFYWMDPRCGSTIIISCHNWKAAAKHTSEEGFRDKTLIWCQHDILYSTEKLLEATCRSVETLALHSHRKGLILFLSSYIWKDKKMQTKYNWASEIITFPFPEGKFWILFWI